MICQVCNKNTATIHYKSSINGSVNEKYLCSECAAKSGIGEKNKTSGMFHTIDIVDSFFDNSSDSLFSGLFGEMLGTKHSSSPVSGVCNGCGMRYNDFVKTGRLGCEKCYETFGNLLRPTLKRIHGNTSYFGKTPIGYEKEDETAEKILVLKEKLSKAVEEQEYEKAATYRDEIKELEKNMNCDGKEEKSNG